MIRKPHTKCIRLTDEIYEEIIKHDGRTFSEKLSMLVEEYALKKDRLEDEIKKMSEEKREIRGKIIKYALKLRKMKIIEGYINRAEREIIEENNEEIYMAISEANKLELLKQARQTV